MELYIKMANGNRGPRGALVGIQLSSGRGDLITDIPHLDIFVVIRALITDTSVSATFMGFFYYRSTL